MTSLAGKRMHEVCRALVSATDLIDRTRSAAYGVHSAQRPVVAFVEDERVALAASPAR